MELQVKELKRFIVVNEKNQIVGELTQEPIVGSEVYTTAIDTQDKEEKKAVRKALIKLQNKLQ